MEKSRHTKISVCIATYNGSKYILQQIQSILKQLKEKDEIIISDDNSTDDTIEILKAINDTRIKIFYNEQEKGYTSNFENGLSKCTGEYIFLCDQDDIWLDNKVDIMINQLNDYDFVLSDCKIINNEEEILHQSFFKMRNSYFSTLGNIIKFGFIGCSFAFNREILNKALPFPKNKKYCTHDNWIFLIGAIFYKFNIIKEPLFLYRRHQQNTSSGGLKSSLNLKDKLFYRIYLIFHILKRWNAKT